jgi:hypothetical protein
MSGRCPHNHGITYRNKDSKLSNTIIGSIIKISTNIQPDIFDFTLEICNRKTIFEIQEPKAKKLNCDRAINKNQIALIK